MKNASFQIEEDCPTFRPFTRESLAKVEARIEEVNEKKRELEKKRAEGEVKIFNYLIFYFLPTNYYDEILSIYDFTFLISCVQHFEIALTMKK